MNMCMCGWQGCGESLCWFKCVCVGISLCVVYTSGNSTLINVALICMHLYVQIYICTLYIIYINLLQNLTTDLWNFLIHFLSIQRFFFCGKIFNIDTIFLNYSFSLFSSKFSSNLIFFKNFYEIFYFYKYFFPSKIP